MKYKLISSKNHKPKRVRIKITRKESFKSVACAVEINSMVGSILEKLSSYSSHYIFDEGSFEALCVSFMNSDSDKKESSIHKYIEFYLLRLMNLKNSRSKVNLLYKNFIIKFRDLKKFNLDEESFFIDLRTKILDE